VAVEPSASTGEFNERQKVTLIVVVGVKAKIDTNAIEQPIHERDDEIERTLLPIDRAALGRSASS
jgi:hypothetical protein